MEKWLCIALWAIAKLSIEEIKTIVEEGKIGPLDGFKSKAGKPFSAMLKVDEDFKVKFDFGSGEGGEAEEVDYTQFESICTCPLAEKGLCSDAAGKVYALPGSLSV